MLKRASILLLAVWCACLAAAAGAESKNAEIKNDDQGARQLTQLVNRERERAGMDALAWDDRIAEAARRHARMM
ncbi:MAG: CAP domain-containing protein, partial [Acidobacteriota bacterium]|nr:CAP domain-containing protein [Acidobacteriota bacterium]